MGRNENWLFLLHSGLLASEIKILEAHDLRLHYAASRLGSMMEEGRESVKKA